jgi:predicted 2-oxoglutarate/Fe(II)-dependent dioxygenase YbiX
MSDFIEVPGFAGTEECREVIAAYEALRPTEAATVGYALWDGKVVYSEKFHAHLTAAALLSQWREKAKAIVAAHAAAPVRSDALLVMRWDEGDHLDPHYDDRNMDGTPNWSSWREWAGLVYLNDDFAGGEIHLPELGVEYKPRAGSFCFFPASRLHGVKRIEQGKRYTCAQWFNRIKDSP